MTILFIGGVIAIILIVNFVFTMEAKRTNEHKGTLLRLYLLIISIVAIGGGTIALGFFVYPTLMKTIISDEEYTKHQRQYTNCTSKTYEFDKDKETLTRPTNDKITQCQNEALATGKESRSYEYKETIIVSLTRFFIFAILFITHFPFFIKQNKKAD